MSASDDANRADEAKAGGQQAPVDRARQRRWVPSTAVVDGNFVSVAGEADIAEGARVGRDFVVVGDAQTPASFQPGGGREYQCSWADQMAHATSGDPIGAEPGGDLAG